MRTIKTIPLVLFALFVLSVTQSKAQSIPKNTYTLDVGADAMLPTGNAHYFLKTGIGGTARLNYGLSDKVAITLTSGYYYYNKTGPYQNLYDGFSVIPVKAGVKYFVIPGVYINAEGGAAFQRSSSVNFTNGLISGGAGWVYKGLDISARYEKILSQNFNAVGFRIAYGFKL